jgi:hypothetical protein
MKQLMTSPIVSDSGTEFAAHSRICTEVRNG